MDTGYFVQLCVQTFWIIFILSLPTVIAASVIGIIISPGPGYNAVTGSNIAFFAKNNSSVCYACPDLSLDGNNNHQLLVDNI